MNNFKINPFRVCLEENFSAPREVQLLRTGDFNHDVYGHFNITPQILLAMKTNFDKKVRGIDLAVDYSHESDREAAGWMSDVLLKNNDTELWAKVNWTPKGKAILEYKEYRYLSADFTFNYIDNETKAEFGATLLGAGLTNRPFVKEMAPAVALTENSKGIKMTLDELKIENKKLSDQVEGFQKKEDEMKQVMGDMSPEQMKAKIAELEALVAQMKSEKEMGEKAAVEAKQFAEKTEKFNKLLSEGKAVEVQRDAFMKDDMGKFIELTEKPNMNPKGSGGKGIEQINSKSETPAQDEIIALAEKLVADKSAKDLTIAQAMVLKDEKNSELVKKYNAEVSL